MKILIIYNIKFKKDEESLKKILYYNAFRPINSTTFIGELSNDELELLKNEIKATSNEKDSIIVIPLCKSCSEKTDIIGKEIPLKEEEYVIL